MAKDRFLIAPFNKGLQEDVRPWLIADDAFAKLSNAYVYEGRVRKRFGTLLMNSEEDSSVAQLYSRLRMALAAPNGITNGAGAATGTVPGAIFKIGQSFSIGDEIFTVTTLGAPAAMITTGASTTMTYDTTNGNYVFAGAAGTTQIYFYPAEPVMGITHYEQLAVNNELTYAFDTQFAYAYSGTAWFRLGTAIWTGSNSEFFWSTNYRGDNNYTYLLFTTNFKTSEMKFWNGTTATWTAFAPQYLIAGGANTIKAARVIVSFKNRLLLFNTVEYDAVSAADQKFPHRCRYSQNGSPVETEAFHQDDPKRGDHVDCPTREAIISAKKLKGRLIVFFERSTWELVYTANQAEPFVWRQLNQDLGCESTFSVVPFDKVLLSVGNVGIHACNGLNVERVDKSIPNFVYNIHNDDDGIYRVHGIKDYTNELVYWTIPSDIFPNKVLVFNYTNGAWALNDDSFTTFGYYQNPTDIIWETWEKEWGHSIEPWDSGTSQAKFRQVIAGNQQGYTFIVSAGTPRNAPSMQITNMTYVGDIVTIVMIDHNLSFGDFIIIEEAQGITNLNGKIYTVQVVDDEDTIRVTYDSESPAVPLTTAYKGGGTAALVSRIDIKTKEYNFYLKQAKNAYISKVDFCVDKIVGGQITVDSFVSSSPVSLLTEGTGNNSIIGTNILETSPYDIVPLEVSQDRVWHPLYFQAEGEVVQLRLYMSDTQLKDPVIAMSDFQLNAMVFYAQPVGRLQ